ncbi:hypothetical protein TWF970_008054 [Orbilia oligospora]|uniref:Uncharacterized protein n=1 Tax=Orbilia oligospora TaxID=2813651 RepID=A0A7C8VJX8_ORBOL|nr:hypothetical protein TWF970_008054 [Orbilia oligospora]
MAIKERAPCLTEIKSESRSVIRKCYSKLIIPNFREYNVKTADLKAIVYGNWFKIGGGPTTPTTFRKVMRKNSLSVLFDPTTKPEFPKLTYLLNHEKATIYGGIPQLDNTTGKSIAAGGIKRLEIVPRSNENPAPGAFGLTVQCAYTGDYLSATNCSNPLINIQSNRTDKNVAIVSLIMGEEDLPFVAIQKLGTRTEHDVTADTGETKESFGLMADALGDMGAEGVPNDVDQESTDEVFEGAVRETTENAVDETLEEEGYPALGDAGRAGNSDKWGKRSYYQGGRRGGGKGWEEGWGWR